MKKVLIVAQVILFAALNFFLFLTLTQISNTRTVFNKFDYELPVYNGIEDFNPALSSRLNSMDKLEIYCDSLFKAQNSVDKSFTFSDHYPELASGVVRKKFYHGYSSYGFSNNYMALLVQPLITKKWISAIVIPDDIMKYPYAACSQQAIVMMELLRRKGFTTRRVGFSGGKEYSGHFTFEVLYNSSWHYFDPNQEPDRAVLDAYDRPSIEFLAKHEDILLAAYKRWEPARALAVLKNYSYGKPNRFEAPRALVYQRVTKFLSYTVWLLPLLAFIFVRRSYLRLTTSNHVRNRRVSLPTLAAKGSLSYYSKNRA